MKLLLALALLTAGCGNAQPTQGVVNLIPEGDSVRWTQQEKSMPTALSWPSGAMNLWVRGDMRSACPVYPYGISRTKYSVVYKAQLSPWFLADDTTRGVMVDHGGEENCVVTGGAFWVVNEGDSVLRGLAETTVAVQGCGARTEYHSLRLVRAPTASAGRISSN